MSSQRPSQPSSSSIRSARYHRSVDTKCERSGSSNPIPAIAARRPVVEVRHERRERGVEAVPVQRRSDEDLGLGQRDRGPEVAVSAGQRRQRVDRVVAAVQLDEHEDSVADLDAGRRHRGDDRGWCRRRRAPGGWGRRRRRRRTGGGRTAGGEQPSGQGEEPAAGDRDHDSRFSGLTRARVRRTTGSVHGRWPRVVAAEKGSGRPSCSATRSRSPSSSAIRSGSAARGRVGDQPRPRSCGRRSSST